MDKLIYIVIGVALIGFALFFQAAAGEPKTFTDADADGEPDETPDEKARALEEGAQER